MNNNNIAQNTHGLPNVATIMEHITRSREIYANIVTNLQSLDTYMMSLADRHLLSEAYINQNQLNQSININGTNNNENRHASNVSVRQNRERSISPSPIARSEPNDEERNTESGSSIESSVSTAATASIYRGPWITFGSSGNQFIGHNSGSVPRSSRGGIRRRRPLMAPSNSNLNLSTSSSIESGLSGRIARATLPSLDSLFNIVGVNDAVALIADFSEIGRSEERGACEEEINAATTCGLYRDLKPDNVEEDNANAMCIISYIQFRDESEVMKINHCSHIFMETSLREWFRRSKLCPLCRYNIGQSVGSSASHASTETYSSYFSSDPSVSNRPSDEVSGENANNLDATRNTATRSTSSSPASTDLTFSFTAYMSDNENQE